jgi:hypothetical protein
MQKEGYQNPQLLLRRERKIQGELAGVNNRITRFTRNPKIKPSEGMHRITSRGKILLERQVILLEQLLTAEEKPMIKKRKEK